MNNDVYDKWRETDGSLIDPDARPHYDPDDQLDPFEEDLDDQLDPFEEDPEATTNKPYYQDNWATLYLGDSLKTLKELPDNFIQTCVTSPPYWGLRDYGIADQLGLEETPEAYVDNMVKLFREVWRVLKKDGTLWLNLGDSYNNKIKGLKPKDLVGIPWRVAFALQADGWYLRSDIIWAKPNPMPESVTDRPTKSHEHIFLMSKSKQYYYDAEAIKEESTWFEERPSGMERNGLQYKDKIRGKYSDNKDYGGGGTSFRGHSGNMKADGTLISGEKRNKRDVWTVNTHAYKDAHFATFPPKLIEPCILAGAAKKSIVLDPFAGSGTVAFVSKDHNRKSISIDLNAEYLKIQKKRLEQEIFNFNSGMERNGSQYLAKVKGQQHIPSGWDTSVGSGGHTKLTGRYVKKLKD